MVWRNVQEAGADYHASEYQNSLSTVTPDPKDASAVLEDDISDHWGKNCSLTDHPLRTRSYSEPQGLDELELKLEMDPIDPPVRGYGKP